MQLQLPLRIALFLGLAGLCIGTPFGKYYQDLINRNRLQQLQAIMQQENPEMYDDPGMYEDEEEVAEEEPVKVGCITHLILVVRRTNEDWAKTTNKIRFVVTVGSDSKNIQFEDNFGTYRIAIRNITIGTFGFENSCIRATDIDGLALTKPWGENGWNVDTVFVMAGVHGCYEKYVVLSATHNMRQAIHSGDRRYDLPLLPQF